MVGVGAGFAEEEFSFLSLRQEKFSHVPWMKIAVLVA